MATVKLTEKQWEVLGDLERTGRHLMSYIDWRFDGVRVSAAACERLVRLGMIELSPCSQPRGVMLWMLSLKGRDALAARRAEKDKMANEVKKLKTYRVTRKYVRYLTFEVVAETEQRAIDKAKRSGKAVDEGRLPGSWTAEPIPQPKGKP
jgi:hypothetical protein